MNILLPTDVFPPGSVGGAAWSAHALARALIDCGHTVTAVVPARGRRGVLREDALGVPTLRWGYRTPQIPFVQNYFRHERLWGPFAGLLAEVAGPAPLVIHAQHVQVAPAAVMAGRRCAAPAVVTVRDHWPWDYFATGLHGDRVPYLRASLPGLAVDLPARLGVVRGVLALPALPYLLAHLRRRAAFLAQADAVIAVSGYIAHRLAAIVPDHKIHVIPNMVDIAANERCAAAPPETPLDGPFLLFVGKLERNKGAGLLMDIFRALRAQQLGEQVFGPAGAAPVGLAAAPSPPREPPLALVVAGSGTLRGELERELAALGVRAHFLAWAPHDEVLRLMARCELLLFPSAWGEPLSRVLLEAAALGAPILAMPTGGTADIVSDGVSGALARTPEQFARRMDALLHDPAERRRLGAGAYRAARARFATEAVAPQVERLYERLLSAG